MSCFPNNLDYIEFPSSVRIIIKLYDLNLEETERPAAETE